MDFIDQLKQFSKRVDTLKDSIQTEEATKTAIIMPFFSMLGYDVFNPQEFVPEYTADVGIKKGEKVDYAIMKDDTPVIQLNANPYLKIWSAMTPSFSAISAQRMQNLQF